MECPAYNLSSQLWVRQVGTAGNQFQTQTAMTDRLTRTQTDWISVRGTIRSSLRVLFCHDLRH